MLLTALWHNDVCKFFLNSLYWGSVITITQFDVENINHANINYHGYTHEVLRATDGDKKALKVFSVQKSHFRNKKFNISQIKKDLINWSLLFLLCFYTGNLVLQRNFYRPVWRQNRKSFPCVTYKNRTVCTIRVK